MLQVKEIRRSKSTELKHSRAHIDPSCLNQCPCGPRPRCPGSRLHPWAGAHWRCSEAHFHAFREVDCYNSPLCGPGHWFSVLGPPAKHSKAQLSGLGSWINKRIFTKQRFLHQGPPAGQVLQTSLLPQPGVSSESPTPHLGTKCSQPPASGWYPFIEEPKPVGLNPASSLRSSFLFTQLPLQCLHLPTSPCPFPSAPCCSMLSLCCPHFCFGKDCWAPSRCDSLASVLCSLTSAPGVCLVFSGSRLLPAQCSSQ